MHKNYQPGTVPSDYAAKTAGQRAADYAKAQREGRTFFRGPIGDLSAVLSEEGQERLLAFFESGQAGWFDVANTASTWVSRFGYWVQNMQGGLAIEFHDGATCWYPSLGYRWYAAMQGAPSKGRFIHEYIYKKVGYQLVSG